MMNHPTSLTLVSVGRRSATPPTGRSALVRQRPTAAPGPVPGAPATVHALPAPRPAPRPRPLDPYLTVADLDEQIAGVQGALADADRAVDVLERLLDEKRVVRDALGVEVAELQRVRRMRVAIFGEQDGAQR